MQPKSLQQLLSLPVRLLMALVNGSVNLDDEPRFVAIEVYDEGPDWLLPAELEASQLSISQCAPKHSLARLWRNGRPPRFHPFSTFPLPLGEGWGEGYFPYFTRGRRPRRVRLEVSRALPGRGRRPPSEP